MRLLLASNNRHKKAEFESIFPAFTIVTPGDLGLEFDVEETGTTFLENALLKARRLETQAKQGELLDTTVPTAVVADDSGICVDALGGGPGIYSARFGSPDGGATELDASSRNALLLDAIAGAESRAAHFVCCMVALMPGDRLIVAQESWHGEIAREPSRGAGGFGYDPVFLVPDLGRTAADLEPEEKNRMSHRGRASAVLAAAMERAAAYE